MRVRARARAGFSFGKCVGPDGQVTVADDRGRGQSADNWAGRDFWQRKSVWAGPMGDNDKVLGFFNGAKRKMLFEQRRAAYDFCWGWGFSFGIRRILLQSNKVRRILCGSRSGVRIFLSQRTRTLSCSLAAYAHLRCAYAAKLGHRPSFAAYAHLSCAYAAKVV